VAALRGSRGDYVSNFVAMSYHYGDIALFPFQGGGRPPSWILKIWQFYWLTVCRGSKCITMPNFVEIGQSVAEISHFWFFKMAAVRHLGFVVRVFGPHTKSIWWSLSLCKIEGNHVLDERAPGFQMGSKFPMERGNFRAQGAARCKV